MTAEPSTTMSLPRTLRTFPLLPTATPNSLNWQALPDLGSGTETSTTLKWTSKGLQT